VSLTFKKITANISLKDHRLKYVTIVGVLLSQEWNTIQFYVLFSFSDGCKIAKCKVQVRHAFRVDTNKKGKLSLQPNADPNPPKPLI
jgi:ribosome-binding factor A